MKPPPSGWSWGVWGPGDPPQDLDSCTPSWTSSGKACVCAAAWPSPWLLWARGRGEGCADERKGMLVCYVLCFVDRGAEVLFVQYKKWGSIVSVCVLFLSSKILILCGSCFSDAQLFFFLSLQRELSLVFIHEVFCFVHEAFSCRQQVTRRQSTHTYTRAATHPGQHGSSCPGCSRKSRQGCTSRIHHLRHHQHLVIGENVLSSHA